MDARGGGTEEHPPQLWGAERASPTRGWIAFALCLLENEICRGRETRGLQWLCTELARGEKNQNAWVIGASPGAGDPTAVSPSRRTLPRPNRQHGKLLVLQSPSCSSCAAVFFGTGCAWSRRVRGPQQHPACPVPRPSRAPKDFAPGSEDVTTATTGRAQRRCQVCRGSIGSSPGKPPEETHPIPGHPSQSGISISTRHIHPNPGHPSQLGTSIPARPIWLYKWDLQWPERAERTALQLCFWVPQSLSPAGNQGHKPPREA